MPVIKQMLIPATNKKTRPGKKRVPKYITIHETGNTNKGATALSHANLQFRGNPRLASWHYTVDDKDAIYQSVPDDENAYAAGDGAGPGNTLSIQIEICTNSDGDFLKAVENAAWLVRYLMAKHKLTTNDVVQHNHWSGKNCPENLRKGSKGINWNGFIAMLRDKPVAIVDPVSVDKPKEVDELKFSSPALKAETELSLNSKARREIIVAAAIKGGAHASWADKLKNDTITNADYLGLSVKYLIDTNK